MKTIRNILFVFYTVILVIAGVFMLAVAARLITYSQIARILDAIEVTKNLRISLGITGGALIFVSILILNLFMGKLQREKTISFNNPDGRVSISLHAIEDYVKKIGLNIPEIRDIKSDVVAGKKGIEIKTRVTLWSDVNIPETTERIQGVIKVRLQEMLGIEETIFVEVNVSKIVHREEAKKKTY